MRSLENINQVPKLHWSRVQYANCCLSGYLNWFSDFSKFLLYGFHWNFSIIVILSKIVSKLFRITYLSLAFKGTEYFHAQWKKWIATDNHQLRILVPPLTVIAKRLKGRGRGLMKKLLKGIPCKWWWFTHLLRNFGFANIYRISGLKAWNYAQMYHYHSDYSSLFRNLNIQ